MSDRYASGDAYWRDPAVESPPMATKLLLLNPSGVAVMGHFDPRWCVAWSPLPKVPVELKAKLAT
jgi:hypothetical protein